MICTKCKNEKTDDEFPMNQQTRRKRDTCRKCTKVMQDRARHERMWKNSESYRNKTKTRYDKWRKANPEKHAAAGAKWYANNKERSRHNTNKWRESHPSATLQRLYRRKVRLLGAELRGTHSDSEWKELCKQTDGRCAKCGKRCKLTRDHIIPLTKGGSNDIGNIQPLCMSCNSSKGQKHINYMTK